jgi:hypothetical protein
MGNVINKEKMQGRKTNQRNKEGITERENGWNKLRNESRKNMRKLRIFPPVSTVLERPWPPHI